MKWRGYFEGRNNKEEIREKGKGEREKKGWEEMKVKLENIREKLPYIL
jgi:hypothetical protein